MGTTQGVPVGHEDIQAPSGRTRWWVVALILGLPALLIIGFFAMVAIWVLADDSSEAEQRPPHSLQVSVGDPWAGSTPTSSRTSTM
ncbi:hypothetical protein [Streptomyces sp. SID12501]|uniref:Uncharacterized protein n=1 Tax=Streptomyces sp. SID12501 TaxID=2706042 RepID=A0A6B3C5R2_9ACTN|nr:hypothetical protein [Streptomyces sp. SID12501]NEC92157.1 hypothetical protein [Streptomyces sp. SID12501]